MALSQWSLSRTIKVIRRDLCPKNGLDQSWLTRKKGRQSIFIGNMHIPVISRYAWNSIHDGGTSFHGSIDPINRAGWTLLLIAYIREKKLLWMCGQTTLFDPWFSILFTVKHGGAPPLSICFSITWALFAKVGQHQRSTCQPSRPARFPAGLFSSCDLANVPYVALLVDDCTGLQLVTLWRVLQFNIWLQVKM